MLTTYENIEAVKKMITTREVADDVCISFGSYQAIFTDVKETKHAAVKIVPKFQNFEQK